MQSVMRFVLLGLLCAFGLSYANHSVPGEFVAEFKIDAKDARLLHQDGMLYFDGQPFSGMLIERYDNHRRKSETGYRKGKMDGLQQTWFSNGAKKTRRFYKGGRKHGLHQGWWLNGGQQFEYHFVNGKYDGEQLQWYANGQLAQQFFYEDGIEVGTQQAWRENGKLYINLVIIDGRKFGVFKAKPCFTVKDGEGQYVKK